MQNPSVITCGLSMDSRAKLSRFLNGCEEQAFASDQLVALMDAPPEQEPVAVFCGNEMTDPPPIEAAQFLRSQFHTTPIYFVTDDVPNFERRAFIKNGYTDTFSLKMDGKLLERAMSEAIAAAKGTPVYRAARLMDIQPDDVLGFDTAIYLSANDKYVRFSNAGDTLDAGRIERLKKHGFRSVHIPVAQMKQYYDYAANRLQGVTAPDQKAACVRDLLGGVIVELDREATFAEGRAVMTQASEIISSYVQATASGSCYQRILELSDEGADAYAHAANVSTIAALIALGTGRAKPDHLALAGLLHDSGAPVVGEDLETRDFETLDPRERALFAAHIPATLELIRKRKILLPQEVTRAIAEHHERYDGRGIPEGKFGAKISIEAQILAIADSIDRWSAVVPGQPRRPMMDWVRAQRERLARGDRSGPFDPELLEAALGLFPEN